MRPPAASVCQSCEPRSVFRELNRPFASITSRTPPSNADDRRLKLRDLSVLLPCTSFLQLHDCEARLRASKADKRQHRTIATCEGDVIGPTIDSDSVGSLPASKLSYPVALRFFRSGISSGGEAFASWETSDRSCLNRDPRIALNSWRAKKGRAPPHFHRPTHLGGTHRHD
jgi:hypothetical protein